MKAVQRWFFLSALKWLAIVSPLAFAFGCSAVPFVQRIKPPAFSVALPSGSTLTQTGAAQIPAKVESGTQTHSLPLPAGTLVEFNEKLGTVSYRLSKDSVVTTTARTEKAEAPQAFTPPAPPTAAQTADAQARWFFWGGLIIGAAAAVFGLVRGWDFVMYGGSAVAAGCGVALFAQTHPLLFVLIGGGTALAFAGPYLWHKHVKPSPPASGGV